MGGLGGVATMRSRSIERLWQEVWRTPWSMQARSVLGDALQEAGNEHGELIAVQLALERLPGDDEAADTSSDDVWLVREALELRQTQLLERLRPALLGRFASKKVTWRAGFIDGATVNDVSDLTALLGCRAAWPLRVLRVLAVIDDMGDVIRRLRPGRGATLEELRLGDRGEHFGCERPFAVQPLLDELPRLRLLELWSSVPQFAKAHARSLEALTVDPLFGASDVLEGLSKLSAPALKSLTISLAETVEWPPSLLGCEQFHSLQHLGLDGPYDAGAVSAALRSRLARSVTKVTLRLPRWVHWLERDDLSRLDLGAVREVTVIAPHLSRPAAQRIERRCPRFRVVHGPDPG